MFATIYLPNFFLQAAIRHQHISASTPVGLIDERGKKPLVIQLNDAAEKAGVRVGMAPSQGLARCLGLVIKSRSMVHEEARTNFLLQYSFSLSRPVESTGAGVGTIHFTRTPNL